MSRLPQQTILDLTCGLVESQSLVQLQAPAQIRGRVIGVYNMAGMGLRTFSGISVGIAGGMVGIHNSLSLSAALLLVMVLTIFIAMRPPAAAAGA